MSAAPTTAPNCARRRFCWGITNVTVAMLSDTDVAHFGHLLETELTELLAASERSHDARDAVALDQAQQGRLSRIDAMQQQEMALEQERRRQRELRRVEAALQRIDEGTYGECVRCGDLIDPRRLEADPATPICHACAATG